MPFKIWSNRRSDYNASGGYRTKDYTGMVEMENIWYTTKMGS